MGGNDAGHVNGLIAAGKDHVLLLAVGQIRHRNVGVLHDIDGAVSHGAGQGGQLLVHDGLGIRNGEIRAGASVGASLRQRHNAHQNSQCGEDRQDGDQSFCVFRKFHNTLSENRE